MTIEEVKRILKNERECVTRQDTPMCNRDECGCQCCDLIQDTGKVLEAYDIAINLANVYGAIVEHIRYIVIETTKGEAENETN